MTYFLSSRSHRDEKIFTTFLAKLKAVFTALNKRYSASIHKCVHRLAVRCVIFLSQTTKHLLVQASVHIRFVEDNTDTQQIFGA